MSDEKTVIQTLDNLRDEVVANRNTTERAIGALAERVGVLEQRQNSTETSVDRLIDQEWPYLRNKLDSIDEKVDGNRIALARWAGIAAASVAAFEIIDKFLV